MQLLLEMGDSAEIGEGFGHSLLHDVALHSGHAGIARLLIRAGVDVSIKMEEGSTALHNAAALGHAGMVQVLFEHGADPSCKTDCGCTPLHHAGVAVNPEPGCLIPKSCTETPRP